VLRVLAGDDLRELGDRDPGRVQAGRDHGDVRIRGNLVHEQAVALVTDVVVVRDRVAGLDDLVGDRRTCRGLARDGIRPDRPIALEAAAFGRDRLDVRVDDQLLRRAHRRSRQERRRGLRSGRRRLEMRCANGDEQNHHGGQDDERGLHESSSFGGYGALIICARVKKVKDLPGTRRMEPMCRNIHTLFNFEPPANGGRDFATPRSNSSAKISGFTKPSQANEEAFARAVDEVTAASHRMLDALVTSAAPKDREVEAERARARAAKRFGPRPRARS